MYSYAELDVESENAIECGQSPKIEQVIVD